MVCVRNKGAEDLVLHKIYLVLPDPIAALDDYLRIVDESGEDYLYPANYFIAIQLPMPVKRALRAVPA
ncbi:MAG: hypothetical protein HY327_06255 [Chloroflexi bacterium]|nr:hypothetical protein [Chloroflexota bacterium]